jgi:hypothetical protein
MGRVDQRNAILDIVALMEKRTERASEDSACRLAQCCLGPPLALLGENGLELAFEEVAGIFEVLFGGGGGGSETLKRFVEDADDPLLFRKRGNTDEFVMNEVSVKGRNARTTCKPL